MFLRTIAYAVLSSSCTAVTVDYHVAVPGVGPVVGGASRYAGVAAFLGIPYAKPPLGDLRWQIPEVHDPWIESRNATSYGSECMQLELGHLGKFGSEDCLFLNVFTPDSAHEPQKKLPVMFWIHGGGYQSGSGSTFAADALVFSSNLSVVVVTINYRLNIFGFACSQEIQRRTSDGSCGNFGIQDQRFAMDWVSKHIEAFGGDGSDVTIFGESAGGSSVINHLAQSASFHLYTKAIVESGAARLGTTIQAASKGYSSLLQATACKDIDCLLKRSGSDIVGKGSAICPVVDGVSLPASPADLISQGKHNKDAAVIIGSNRDEMASPWFSSEFPKNMTELEFNLIIGAKYPGQVGKIKQLYDKSVYPYPENLGPYSQWWWTATRIFTDSVPGIGSCGTRWIAKLLVEGGSSKVYTYLFAHPEQKTIPEIPGTGPGSVIAVHAVEVPYVFYDTFQINPGDEEQLASKVSKYWVTFAATGNPNVGDQPKWPKYLPDTDMDLRLDIGASGIRAEQHLRKAACDFQEAQALGIVDGLKPMLPPSQETLIV